MLSVPFAARLLGLNKSKGTRKSSGSTPGHSNKRRFRFSSANKTKAPLTDENVMTNNIGVDSPIVSDDSSTKSKPLHSCLPESTGDLERSTNLSRPLTAPRSESEINTRASSQSLEMRSQCIDEILTRNGKEVGRINFHIDALWLYDGELSKLPKGRSSKK